MLLGITRRASGGPGRLVGSAWGFREFDVVEIVVEMGEVLPDPAGRGGNGTFVLRPVEDTGERLAVNSWARGPDRITSRGSHPASGGTVIRTPDVVR